MNGPFSRREQAAACAKAKVGGGGAWFGKVASMPQPDGSQRTDTFVGRSRELAVLSAALRQAATGDARLALVAGEPGIGKTELARAFARAAGNDGALVLWGSAWEDGGAPPYWPWVQVLRSYGRQAGAEALAEAAGPQAAVLGQLLPELGTAPAPAGPAAGARFALFEAVCRVLDRASQSAPLAVILDDLHAAGRPSALLLRFAAAARLSRVLLLATYRTAEAAMDPDVSDVIATLESVSAPLTLAGLSPGDIRRMLPGADADVLAVVQRRGEGNPLFVSQVARLLGQGAATVEEMPVPAGIRQAVRRQVTGLGDIEAGDGTPAAGDVLATAAALGPGIDPVLVADVLSVAPGPVARLCDRATEIGLLGPGRDAGEVYRFRHTLIRETLYAELTPQSRAQAHRRIAEVLENRPGRSHAELAYHFLRAAPASAEAAARAVRHSRLAGQEALDALAYEEAAGHFRHALDVQQRAAQATLASRCELLLSLAEALTKTGPDPDAARVIDEAVRLARHADEPRLLAAAALLSAQHLDFNAPADTTTALLREAAAALDPADHALRARTLARLAITLAPDPAAARAAAGQAVQDAREAVARHPDDRDPDGRAAAAALAISLAARQHVLWGTQDPADALAAAGEIVTAARRAGEPETELDGRVLRLTHLLELGDGPAAQRVLPELGRMAESLRQPLVRLVALSRRSTLAALTGDLASAAESARQAFQTGQAASLPDADAVYWGQLFAVWLHADLPGDDEQWMERELRDLVARSHMSVAHAAALVQIEAAHGATEQARGRLDELVGTGLGTLRPDMLYVWALTLLARGCVLLRATRHAPRLYQALAPYAGRVAVAAGAVMCSGSSDFYLAGLAALSDDATTAERHYRAAVGCHRRLGARPMLAHTLREYALLLRRRAAPGDLPAAAAALTEARAIAADCGMTRLLAALDQQDQPGQPGEPGSTLTLTREDGFWLVGYADARAWVPDSLGLRYLDLLVRNPGRELAAVELVRLAASAGPAGRASNADGLHDASGADDILDRQALAAYRQRIAGLDEELAEADEWHDTERASRLRAEKDFLVRELAAATGLGGRPRQLGSESERARLNVTRAIRTAIARIRDRAPDAAARLDQAVRTGTRCSYHPPNRPT
jgi:AAA ATPase domain